MRNPYIDNLIRMEELRRSAPRALPPSVTLTPKSRLLADVPPETGGRVGYVTNATSRSVVFYVISFLNNQGYSPEQIITLRQQLHTPRRSGKFDIDEIQECFVNQSIYFLELFTQRFLVGFERFLRELEEGSRFRTVFKNYKNSGQVLEDLKRKIYHSNYDCEWMRKDYEDAERHLPNTGIFADSTVGYESYRISPDYLDRLRMRECSRCVKEGGKPDIVDNRAEQIAAADSPREGLSSSQNVKPA